MLLLLLLPLLELFYLQNPPKYQNHYRSDSDERNEDIKADGQKAQFILFAGRAKGGRRQAGHHNDEQAERP